ncbi:MAG: hypothetical protein SAJ37_20375 [Oscillatoria sp. PMC 1068.18]|nr:hypothetical protein [Oscillatoria sp. PMC 1076.18]MEC4991097.1 hypothetical protein [Oscillatoria sp. PMC 1068.18]
MVIKKANSTKVRLEKLFEAVESARQMQQDWLELGLDFVQIYVDDVDSDWLDCWCEEENNFSNQGNLTCSVTAFLQGNDPVAVQVRERLGERSLGEIAAELEKSLSLPLENNERLFAVKTVLADRVIQQKTNENLAQNLQDEISLLDLAAELLEKLAQMESDLII